MPETGDLLSATIKLFALMTPPAVLSAFLGYTSHSSEPYKHRIALKTSLAIFVLGAVLYIWGAKIFEIFGFTLDAFRIGSGVLLMLTAINLIHDEPDTKAREQEGDISIVPLAVPLSMGPASIGAIMVMGAQAGTGIHLVSGLGALALAALGMYLLLRMADLAGRLLGSTGIAVLAKLTGLLLAAIAAQAVFTGMANFLK